MNKKRISIALVCSVLLGLADFGNNTTGILSFFSKAQLNTQPPGHEVTIQAEGNTNLIPTDVYAFCAKHNSNSLAVENYFKQNNGKHLKDSLEFYSADTEGDTIRVRFLIKSGSDICVLPVQFDRNFTEVIQNLSEHQRVFIDARINFRKYKDTFEGVYITS